MGKRLTPSGSEAPGTTSRPPGAGLAGVSSAVSTSDGRGESLPCCPALSRERENREVHARRPGQRGQRPSRLPWYSAPDGKASLPVCTCRKDDASGRSPSRRGSRRDDNGRQVRSQKQSHPLHRSRGDGAAQRRASG